MKMTAIKSLRYGGEQLQPGEEFAAKTARDYRLLKAIGKAAPVADDADETALPSPAPAAAKTPANATQPSQGRGRYQRRDMRAQD